MDYDDAVDEKLNYMEKLIMEEHKFTESEWPVGDTSTPCVKVNAKKRTVVD